MSNIWQKWDRCPHCGKDNRIQLDPRDMGMITAEVQCLNCMGYYYTETRKPTRGTFQMIPRQWITMFNDDERMINVALSCAKKLPESPSEQVTVKFNYVSDEQYTLDVIRNSDLTIPVGTLVFEWIKMIGIPGYWVVKSF